MEKMAEMTDAKGGTGTNNAKEGRIVEGGGKDRSGTIVAQFVGEKKGLWESGACFRLLQARMFE